MGSIKIEPYKPGALHTAWVGLSQIFLGVPQETHPFGSWRDLEPEEYRLLIPEKALQYEADSKARPMWHNGVPYFRLPRLLGGWSTCAVMEILDPDVHEGFLVWQVAGGKPGLSLIPFRRRVRALIGPKPVRFSCFHADGRLLELRSIIRTTVFDPLYKRVALR
jgi:hypothetical protein